MKAGYDMKFKKICKCCGKEFETNSPQKLYCNGPHYLPCPICGTPVLKTDNDFTRPPKCCSSKCTHELRKRSLPTRKCIFCGKEFVAKSGVALVCDDVHYANCEICGKQFVRTIGNKDVTTCSQECTQEKLRRRSREKYGTDHPMQSPLVQLHHQQAMMELYGVQSPLQSPEIKAKAMQHRVTSLQQRLEEFERLQETQQTGEGILYETVMQNADQPTGFITQINKQIAKQLQTSGVEVRFELPLDGKLFDLYLPTYHTVIEIDPAYTHNLIGSHFGKGIPPEYHSNKTKLAAKYDLRCIHIFDWDDTTKIVEMLQPRKSVYARKCTVWRLNLDVTQEFLNRYHLQGPCRGQLLCLGLVLDGDILQVMTFGKPRYNSNYDVELLRLCTKPGVTVVGGASRLFSYATSEYGLHNIISYCDLSKFTGDVYEKIGMKHLRTSPPAEVWTLKGKKITANLLRQRGFDQLFGTNYGKGTSNEQLMLDHGWLPVYDCGQAVYEFK